MKTAILVFLFLSASLNLKAQSNTFPTDHSIWTNQMRSYYLDSDGLPMYTTEWITNYCIDGIDTTINAMVYTEVNRCTAINSTYHGAIRENAGQIFFIPADSTSEFLLYDFNVTAGQSIDILIQSPFSASNFEYSVQTVQISSVDTVTVNNKQRKRINTDAYPWIEGIGSTSGLFMEPYINISNYFVDLVCMSSNDTNLYNINNGYYEQGIQGECSLSLTVPESEPSNIAIYPNPTNGHINIDLTDNRQIEMIKIYNNIGQEISTFTQLSTGIFKFEVNGPAGIYFIELITSEGLKSTKRIFKY